MINIFMEKKSFSEKLKVKLSDGIRFIFCLFIIWFNVVLF